MSYKDIAKDLSIKLNTDLIFYDLETTGLDIKSNTIVQMYICKYTLKEDSFIEKTLLFNPGTYLIGEEAFKKHGLSQEELSKVKHTFADLSKQIYDKFFLDFTGYLCGFNIEHFDNKFLVECFIRANEERALSIFKIKSLDIFKLYQKIYPNKLETIYERLIGKQMLNAHDAKSDIIATIEIANKLVPHAIEKSLIDDGDTTDKVFIDQDFFIYKKDGDYFFAKGKYKDKSLLTSGIPAKNVIEYLLWITNQDVLSSTKLIIEKLIVYVGKKLNF